MSKKEFIRKYRALSPAEKANIKKYWESLYKRALMPETFKLAEQRLLWMRAVDSK